MTSVSSISWTIVWSMSLRTSEGTDVWSVGWTDLLLERTAVDDDDLLK
jgi:hypothetical protein